MRNEPWIKNAPNLLIVTSIFAALAGILLVFVFQDKDLRNDWICPIVFLLISFWLFAWASEQITTAIDEKDVKKYVYILLFYNFAVIALFMGIASIIYLKFFRSIYVFIITLVLLIKPWLRDTKFILFDRACFYEYIKELTGEIEKSQEDHSWLMKFFYKYIKSEKTNCQLPHSYVFTRLAPSTIHGVGVFAIQDIPKGTNVFQGDIGEMRWINKSQLKNLDDAHQKLYDDFCVSKGQKLGCPQNFNSLTIGWYLNESKNDPNVQCNNNYDFITIRNIKRGEELFTDYSEFSE